jgi:tetratricopeptide (TPR) repeat protein
MTVAGKKKLHHARAPARKDLVAISPAGVRWQNLAVGVFLVLIVLAVFGQTAHFEFINYDDGDNIYENSVVEKGLSLKGVGWAFTHVQVANWIPLTTLSHMLDCQLFGVGAGGHHLVNVFLHAATAVLLFLVLRQMTGSLWRSVFVASVFAVHPLRVESVAWVSERKDVLSAFFFMLALLAYARYAQGRSRIGINAILNYLLALFFFACGLMSKPMVATLPFVLLLLDYLPLKRFTVSSFQLPVFLRLVLEKIPFFLLSAASCAAVAFVPGLAVVPPPGVVTTGADVLPLFERIGGALVSCVVYLRQMVFPAGLAIPYPDPPAGVPAREICLAFILLAAISAGAFIWRKKRPFLLVGWLWFLGMLVPVSGMVAISADVFHADRYTYLPGIGLAIAAAWAVAEWSVRWKFRRLVLGSLMTVVIGMLMACTSLQASYWRDGETLWNHALSCNSANYMARNNLGRVFAQNGQAKAAIVQYRIALKIKPDYLAARNALALALFQDGNVDEAIAEYRKALEINPDFVDALVNLGTALDAKGQVDDAIAQYRRALEINPDGVEARYNLGVKLFDKGELDDAIAQYRTVLEINPDAVQARNNLAIALYQKGRVDEAIVQYQKVLETSPRYAGAHNNLGVAFMNTGRMAEAMDQYRQALEIEPAYVDALKNLAWALATTPDASLRNGAKAVALAGQADQLTGGGNPLVLRTLAAAYAETGRYAEAAATARRGLRLAVAGGNVALAGTLQQEIEIYDAGAPVRDVKP